MKQKLLPVVAIVVAIGYFTIAQIGHRARINRLNARIDEVMDVARDLSKRNYDQGVNAALATIALHDLELSLSAAPPMTWGERSEVVRMRLGVAKP